MAGVKSVIHVLGLKRQQVEARIAVLTSNLKNETTQIEGLMAEDARLFQGTSFSVLDQTALNCVSYNTQVFVWKRWAAQQVQNHQARIDDCQQKIKMLQCTLKTIIVQEFSMQAVHDTAQSELKLTASNATANAQLELWVVKYKN